MALHLANPMSQPAGSQWAATAREASFADGPGLAGLGYFRIRAVLLLNRLRNKAGPTWKPTAALLERLQIEPQKCDCAIQLRNV